MAIEVNGHAWGTDRRTYRARDVLCLTCENCGKRTQVPMRSMNKEGYLTKQEPCATIVVGPFHPAWSGLDDDDWNGATLVNWLGTLKDKAVVVRVPEGFDQGPLDRMAAAIRNVAKEVRVVIAKST